MWWLAAADSYRAAVDGLTRDLDAASPGSDALVSLRDCLAVYRSHQEFPALERDAAEVTEALGRVRYRVQIYGDRVEVSRAADDEDYAADVAATFERVRQGATASYRVRLTRHPEMNHVEEAIADRVVWLFPQPFRALA
jgi:DNA mismatch repair protein MutS